MTFDPTSKNMKNKPNIGDYWLGKKQSPEFIANRTANQKGKIVSEETKEKMSFAKIGEKNPMYVKQHTEEHNAKISATSSGENNHMYGKTKPKEIRDKISATLMGNKNAL